MTSKVKINGGGDMDTNWARAPPAKGPFWRRFRNAIFNPEEKTFLGRTAKRWGIVLVFYLVFYSVLALLIAICFGGMYLTLDEKIPKWTLDKSLIGTNPGVTVRPMPLATSGILQYDRNNQSYKTIVKDIEDFLKAYQGEPEQYSSCNSRDDYGFPHTPCFFIKINKIYDWMPVLYDDVSALPSDMPEDLVDHIKTLEDAKRKKVWVSCTDDKGNITDVEYPWTRGLPEADFPFRNTVGYLSPLVAVKVTASVNKLTTIRCRAWAKNIIYDKSQKEASGYVQIQVYIEDHTQKLTE